MKQPNTPFLFELFLVVYALGCAFLMIGAAVGLEQVLYKDYDAVVTFIEGRERRLGGGRYGSGSLHYVYHYYCEIPEEGNTQVYFYEVADDHIERHVVGEQITVRGLKSLNEMNVSTKARHDDTKKNLCFLILSILICMIFVIARKPEDARYQNEQRTIERIGCCILDVMITAGIYVLASLLNIEFLFKMIAIFLVGAASIYRIREKVKELRSFSCNKMNDQNL